MKYKIILLFIVLACYLGNTSCKKFLDIQPHFKFVDSVALNSLSGLYTTTIGAFSSLKSGNLYGGGIIANSELLADFINTGNIADYGLNELRIHQMESQNAEASGMWGDGYNAILKANLVLANLPKFQKTDTTAAQKDSANLIKAECLFIRAAMHFELVRMFAQPAGYTANNSHLGIPIELTPGDLTVNQSVPRSTVAQVYTQVITDLVTADSLFSILNLKKTQTALQIFAYQYSVQGFLVRAYFEQNNFPMAKQWADSVISTSGLVIDNSLTAVDSLVGSTYTSGFNEVVFQCLGAPPNDEVNGQGATLSSRFSDIPAGSIEPLYIMSPFDSANYLVPSSKQGDLRVKLLYNQNLAYHFFSCKKYSDYYMNIPVMRLEEIYLDRAECENQMGNDAAALADVNVIRAHAGLPADNTDAGAGLLAQIRFQRDIELSMEGDRLFELKRRKQNFIAGYDKTITVQWNSNQLIYPIPLQEVDKNSQMVQNPGF